MLLDVDRCAAPPAQVQWKATRPFASPALYQTTVPGSARSSVMTAKKRPLVPHQINPLSRS